MTGKKKQGACKSGEERECFQREEALCVPQARSDHQSSKSAMEAKEVDVSRKLWSEKLQKQERKAKEGEADHSCKSLLMMRNLWAKEKERKASKSEISPEIAKGDSQSRGE